MKTKKNSFPWGVYVGDLIDGDDSIPVCLDSKNGGFTLLYDNNSEEVAFDFIENVTLKLLEVLPPKLLSVNAFNFGEENFLYLSKLKDVDIYKVANSSNRAKMMFDELEELAQDRHSDILSIDTPTLSEYNIEADEPLQYHLLLINLEYFPDEFVSPKRVKTFFKSAFKVGFYTIAFGNTKEIEESDSKALKAFMELFGKIELQNKTFKINKDIFEFEELFDEFDFEYANDNKTKIIKTLLSQTKAEDDNEKNFLEVPIGKIGTKVLNFELGLKSSNYHAFITGTTGQGKTTLLNTIITEIAKKYTAKEIELYLMDYKPAGAEFIVFKNHPNCKKIFLESKDPTPALMMLKEFEDEMYRRGEIFGGLNIDEYNTKYPERAFTRKILIIDEIQQMFKGDWKEANAFNDLLENIVKLGRSFGLHLILTTQALTEVNIKKSIMGQIPLKISFRLNDNLEAMKIFTTNNDAQKQVVKLKKYHYIYADSNKTVTAKTQRFDKEDIPKILDEIRKNRDADEVITPQIFKATSAQNHEPQKQHQEPKEDEYVPKYGTDKEKEALERLRKMESKNE